MAELELVGSFEYLQSVHHLRESCSEEHFVLKRVGITRYKIELRIRLKNGGCHSFIWHTLDAVCRIDASRNCGSNGTIKVKRGVGGLNDALSGDKCERENQLH